MLVPGTASTDADPQAFITNKQINVGTILCNTMHEEDVFSLHSVHENSLLKVFFADSSHDLLPESTAGSLSER